MTLTDYRSFYDKDFIGAWDLDQGDLTVTIKKCTGGNLTAPGGRKSKRPVVFMAHTEKGFVLNSTNGKTIAGLYGNHVENWPGKRITLYKSMTHSPGSDGEIECIRVRPSVPGEDTKTAAPSSQPPASREPSGDAAAAATITADQAIHIADLLDEHGIKKERLLLQAKVPTLEQMPRTFYERALKWIERASEAK